jgi:hypothetical protein
MREATPDSHPNHGGVAMKYLVTVMPGPLPPPVELVPPAQEVQPLVDLGVAFDRFIPFIERMSAQLAGHSSS